MNYYHRRVREWCADGVEERGEEMVGERDTGDVAGRFSTRPEDEPTPELPPFAGMMPPVRVRLRVLVPGSQRERLRLMIVNVRKIRLRVVVSRDRYN